MSPPLRVVAIVCGLAGAALAVGALFRPRLLVPAIVLILLAGGLGAMTRGR